MSLAVVLQVCPWLSLPRSLLGLGKASVDLFHAFWDGLDELQRAEPLAAAMEAGVNLRTYLRGGGRSWLESLGGYDFTITIHEWGRNMCVMKVGLIVVGVVPLPNFATAEDRPSPSPAAADGADC